jgi:ubiquinol-cytochrome c reductase subunit 6
VSEQASANEEAPEEAPKEAEAEEEEEPEDVRLSSYSSGGDGRADSMQEHPKIRTDCEASPACAPLKHHFEKCQEKVNAGEGYKGEDCVDDMYVFSPFLFFLHRRLTD